MSFMNNFNCKKHTYLDWDLLYLPEKKPQIKLKRDSILNLDLSENIAKVVVKKGKF